MMLEAVIILILAVAVLAFLAAPLLRTDAAEAERVSREISTAAELHSRHAMVLASLKDLEDDRATGKLDDADYETLKNRLTVQAVELMKALDEAKERDSRPVPKGPRPVQSPGPKATGPAS